jgi:hypothetical protein
MPRNGHATTQTATREPNEFYDSLSQDTRDIWDEIGSLGYTPEKGAATSLWFARKTNSKHAATVGPCESLPSLLAGVKEEIAEEAKSPKKETNVVSMNGNGNGRVKQPYLPGAEDIEELDQQADVCLELQDARDLASTAFKDGQLKMIEIMDRHERTTYARGGFNLKITNKRTLQIKQDKNRGASSDKPLETDPDSEAAQVVDPED